MCQAKNLIISFLFLLLAYFSFGQVSNSEIALQQYLAVLQEKGIDSFVVMRQGCIGCGRDDSDTSPIQKGEVIYVLTKCKGKYIVVSLDNYYDDRGDTVDGRSVFKLIQRCRSVLATKQGSRYGNPDPNRRIDPKAIPYEFEVLEIHLPGIHFSLEIARDKFDRMGNNMENEKWFKATRAIIDQFYKVLHTIPVVDI